MLAVLKTQLHLSDEMVSQWISDVMEWAAGGKHDQITENNTILFHYYLNLQV
jgi:hypothetical protein